MASKQCSNCPESDTMQTSIPSDTEVSQVFTWQNPDNGITYKLKTMKVDDNPYFEAVDLCVGIGYRITRVISEITKLQ